MQNLIVRGETVTKLEAMECYQSELSAFPHPRSLESIKTLAMKNGSVVGRQYAEIFMLVREINE